MGRPSKLTEKQWTEIRQRVINGDKPADLAREYGVSKAAVSQRVSKRVDAVKTVANHIVATERALQELSISEQMQAVSLASKLRSISDNMLDGANLQAANFHRLSALAQTELMKVDDADPMTTGDRLKSHMVLTAAANEAAKTPVALLSANKDMVKKAAEPEEAVISGLDHFYGQPG